MQSERTDRELLDTLAVAAEQAHRGYCSLPMATIEGHIYIDRPPEIVFDFVSDERNEPRYNPKMTDVTMLTEEPIGSGTRYIATLESGSRMLTMTTEFTDFVRPTRLGSVSTVSAMQTVGAVTFAQQGSGTLMRWTWDVRLRGAMKLSTPVVAWMGRRQERSIYTGLKTLLESEL